MAVLPPGPRQWPQSASGRIYALETRRQSAQEKPKSDDELIPFSLPGAVAVSASGPYVPLRKGRLFYVLAALGTAGSSNTVVTLYKNGSVLSPSVTVTLGSGVTVTAVNLSASFTIGADRLSVGVTTAGTGAVGLTVECRFS